MRNVHRHSHRNAHTTGTTLLELLVALALIGILTTSALPHIRTILDAIDTRAATNDADALYATARRLALSLGVRVSVAITPSSSTLFLIIGTDTITTRPEHTLHGVTTSASRTLTTYSPTGAALGASNLTLTFTKGSATDTLFISRLGRVRH